MAKHFQHTPNEIDIYFWRHVLNDNIFFGTLTNRRHTRREREQDGRALVLAHTHTKYRHLVVGSC